jgi:TP901 family phage tail tape measure protein
MAGGPIRLPIVSKFDDQGVKAAETALAGFGKNAAVALGAVTAAVGAFGVASVKAFSDFDAEMTKSVAIMGDVSDALRGDMADAAREVAKSTTFSASEAAEAFYFLASAGLTAEQSIGAMPKVAAFAQAGMFDLATATSLLADAQSAMGLTSSDATQNMENLVRVSDVLVKANILANASVEQFSEALTNKAAASMKALNIPLEEGVAVLATFAQQGIKGSEAGTTFNATIRGLTNGVLRFGDRFKAMNIEVYDAQGNFNNMADIVGQMEDAIGGLSVEQQRAALTQLGFTEETLAGTLALLGNSEAIRRYEDSLRDAGGTTDEVANNQLQTFNAQLELMKSRFGDVMLSVGEGLTPTMMTFAEQLGPIIDQLGPALILMFEQLGPVILELVEQMPGFIEALLPLIPVIGDMALLTLSMAQVAIPALQAAMDTFSPIVDALSGVLAEHGEVIGALILGFALMVAVIRIASASLAIYSVATGTATGASSGLFAVLARNPILFFGGLIIGASIAMFTFRDSIRESGNAGRIFLEGWAGVTYGVQWFTRNMVNGAIQFLEILHDVLRIVVQDLINVGRAAVGLGKIELPKLDLPELEVLSLDDYRREMGLLTQESLDPFRPSPSDPAFNSSLYDSQGQAGLQNSLFAYGQLLNLQSSYMGPPALPSQMFNTGMAGQTDYDIYRQGGIINQPAYNITVNAGLGADGATLGADIVDIISQYERLSGPVFARYE